MDLKIVPEKSRSQGSQNGICAWRQDDESVTEHQGSQNEPLWELKWPLSACSGAAQECSPSAQVKAAAAHVYTLKRNQRKKRLSLTYVGVRAQRGDVKKQRRYSFVC